MGDHEQRTPRACAVKEVKNRRKNIKNYSFCIKNLSYVSQKISIFVLRNEEVI